MCIRRIRRPRREGVCPVCRKHTFSDWFEICPVCGWEHDKVQEKDPSFAGGANCDCLIDAAAAYKANMKEG